jgi:hypothetical protein
VPVTASAGHAPAGSGRRVRSWSSPTSAPSSAIAPIFVEAGMDAGAYITGPALVIDGGLTAVSPRQPTRVAPA